MYFPKEQKEPGGCLQTLIITRAIFGILAVPVAIIAGAVLSLMLTLYLFTVSPAFALIPILIGGGGVILFGRWERGRIARDTPPEE